jgi:Holliday junction resolvasome RuvABC ATP-dependent DNA helicase subunit
MSKSLYALLDEERELMDDLEFCDGDNETIKKRLDEIYGEKEKKLVFVSSIYAESKAKAKAMREIAQQAQKRAQIAEELEERLRDYIILGMESMRLKKLQGRLINISRYQIDKLGMPEFIDCSKFPDELVKVTIEPKRKEILSILKTYRDSGEEVPEELKDFFITQVDALRVS